MPNFTDRFIQTLKPRETRYDVRDRDGLVLRISPAGRKTFEYIYTFGGRKRRYKIGVYNPPHFRLADARRIHRELMAIRDAGNDPAGEKQQGKSKADGLTVKELAEVYMERYAKANKKSWRNDEYVLAKEVVPLWGERPVAEITKRDVVELINGIIDRGASRWSNISLTIVRKMFQFAVDQAHLVESPCETVKSHVKDKAGERNLNETEIRIYWNAMMDTLMSETVRQALQSALLLGQRSNEILGMRWEEVQGSWWTIPGSRMKNGKEHRVFLPKLFFEIVGPPKAGLVFPSITQGTIMHHNALSQATQRLLERVNKERAKKDLESIPPFCPRDIRRTVATQLGEMGVDQFIIGKVLSHSEKSVTGRHYNKYQYDREKQKALDSWARRLKKIVTERKTGGRGIVGQEGAK